MKQRLLLCLLLIGVMLYYAVPRLVLTEPGLESVFSVSWLVFAMFAAAGNLTGMLYAPNKRKAKTTANKQEIQQRMRYYQ